MLLRLKDQFVKTAVWVLRVITLNQLPPPVAASGVVLRRNGHGQEVLLLHRSDGAFSLPGGMARYGEDCQATARREIAEETGYQIAIDRLAGVYSQPGRSPRLHAVVIVYACHPIGGDPKGSYEGEPTWAPVDRLPAPMFEDDAQIIRNCLSGKIHSG